MDLSPHVGYYDVLQMVGLDVISAERFGKAKGDLVFLVRKNDVYGVCIVGYGSCTGCDVLRAVKPAEGQAWTEENVAFLKIFAYETAANTIWGTRSQLARHLLDETQTLYMWWGHERGYRDAIKRLLSRIPNQEGLRP